MQLDKISINSRQVNNPDEGMFNVAVWVKKLNYLFIAGNSNTLKNANQLVYK